MADSLWPGLIPPFETVLSARAIHSVYQPLVALDSGAVVGFEALARGPAGTRWSAPDALVAYASQLERLPELDWICRAAACRGALAAGYPSSLPLFVNVEPASSRTPCPPDLEPDIMTAMDRFPVVAEVTERSLARDPAGLFRAIDELRAHSSRIAMDDVGADAASQALMSLVRPDVIKLDRRLTQIGDQAQIPPVVRAVQAEAERTGAVILAEGIETPRHLTTARAMGATLGQGWLFGTPGPLPDTFPTPQLTLPRLEPPGATGDTPWHVAREQLRPELTARRDMLAMSRTVEDMGVRANEPTVLLATFQQAARFNGVSRDRYLQVAHEGTFTAVFAAGDLDVTGAVRACSLGMGDPLIAEWNVIVLGSHVAAGLFARPTDTTEAELETMVSNDRELVVAAARPLLRRLGPGPAV